MELTKGSPVHLIVSQDGECHAAVVLQVTNQFAYTDLERYRVKVRDLETDHLSIAGPQDLHPVGTCPSKSKPVDLPVRGTPVEPPPVVSETAATAE